MTDEARFKYTFPVAKAMERDGDWYIIGEATGPEIDSQNERMAPAAIEDFARQIEDAVRAGNPIQFREIHQRDGVMAELGEVVKGWITPEFHLGVEVKLDRDNPAAEYLYKSVKFKKKKVGMSIFGTVPSRDAFKDEHEFGKSVRTFYKVNLDHIGRTTMPVWYPSLGTVLAKAVDEAAEGDNTVGLNADAPKDERNNQPDENEETRRAEEQVAEQNRKEQTGGETLPEPEEVDAQRNENAPAGSPEIGDTTTATNEGVDSKEKQADEHSRLLAAEAAAPTGLTNAEIAAKAQQFGIDANQLAKVFAFSELAQELGFVTKVQQNPSETNEETEVTTTPIAEKSKQPEDLATIIAKAVEAAVLPLKTELTATQTRLQEVLENTPEGSAPGLVSKAEQDELDRKTYEEEIAKLPPTERMKFALAVKHGKKG